MKEYGGYMMSKGLKTTIEVSDGVLELLDVVKKFNPSASYNDVIYFLVAQYSKQLEETSIPLVNKQLIMEDEDDE
jgi:hypothetical protein